MPKPGTIISWLWVLGFSSFMIACNLLSPNAKTASDFMVSFYSAGLMVVQGRTNDLYPSMATTTWQAAPINEFAHSIFPNLPNELIANFMYSPLVAVLFVPTSMLTPALAMSVWQLLNLGLLLLCVRQLSKSTGERANSINLLALAILFGPTIAALWVGQTSIIFGLAPIAFAFEMLRRERFLQAGLTLSILQLKPQFMIFAVAVSILSGNWKKTIAGLGAGLAAGLALTYMVMPQNFLKWLHSLQLSEQFIGSAGYSMASYLASSFPSVILLMLPQDQRSAYHLIVYMGMLLIGCITYFMLTRLSPSNQNPAARLANIGLIAVLIEVISAPRLVLYDTCILLVPLFFFACSEGAGDANRRFAIISIVAATSYVIACMFTNPTPLLFLLVLCITCLYGLLLQKNEKTTKAAPR